MSISSDVSQMVGDKLSEDMEVDVLAGFVDTIEAMGFEIEDVELIDNQDVVLDLSSQVSDVEPVLEFVQASMETVRFTVTEGNLSNEIVFNDNGSVFLDGVRVGNDAPITEEGVVYKNLFEDYYQVACPYGTSANYDDYLRTVRDDDYDWTKTLNKLTVFAAALLIGIMNPIAGGSFELCEIIAGYFKKYDPYSDCGSYVAKEYLHTKGYWVKSTLAVRKCISSVYSDHNYGGVKKVVVNYFCHKMSY